MSFPASIEKKEIQHLPLLKFEGEIHIVEDETRLGEVIELLNQERVLGFDTETKPTFVKGDYNSTSLIQFTTLTDAYLVRIKTLGIPSTLKGLLENIHVKKIGISIRDDLKDLNKIRSFNPGGFIDLNDIANELGVTQIGVKNLTAIFLGMRISKSQQTSNWENQELTKAQRFYAATDAWVCLKMFDMLEKKGYI